MASLHLNLTGAPKALVDPVVVLSVIDHYMRRPEGQARVIGALLGSRNVSGKVTIRSSFPVPHSETEDEVAVDMEFMAVQRELHAQTAPEDEVVGWYATGKDITEYSILLHEFFASASRTARNPIHLTVDTGLTSGRLAVEGYVSSVLQVGAASFGTQFHPVEVSMNSFEAEKIGLNLISRGLTSADGTTPLTQEMDNIGSSLTTLSKHLDEAKAYVDGVLDGSIEPNNKIGRFLLKAVSTVPQFESETFSDMLDSNIKDLLMILYLSNLIRTQLHLSDRIDKVVAQQLRKDSSTAAATATTSA